MKILVTGGAGFIGSHLVEQLLSDGHEVVVVDDFNDFYSPDIKENNIRTALTNPRYTLVRADIVNRKALDEIFQAHTFDAIVHLAARAGVRPSLQQPHLYVDVNVQGTTHLMELARLHQVKKFVFGSSSSVYGINTKVPFSEMDHIFNPISPYAATKAAGEKLAHVYHHLYGIDMVCLRFFTVYGPRQRPDLAIHKFTRAIYEGRVIEQFGDGSTRRDYTFYTDILQGVTASLYKPLGFEIFNLGESQTVPLHELIRLIEEALGKKAEIKQMPEQPGDVPVTFADVSKAKKMLDYKPSVKIEQGIEKFVQWFLEHEKQRK